MILVDEARLLYEEFMRKSSEGLENSNENILLTAYQRVKAALREVGYVEETVHLAYKIFSLLGDKGLEERIILLKQYLTTPISKEEHFWAQWEIVDMYALLKKCKETVTEQVAFLEWTEKNMSQEYWMKAMYDGTQAICWEPVGQLEAWLNIYQRHVKVVASTEENRNIRALYVRTAAEIYQYYDRHTEAWREVDRLEKINNEDPQWTEYLVFWTGVITTKLEIYRSLGKTDEYEKLLQEAIHEIYNRLRKYETEVSLPCDIADTAHEIGACLMWSGRYAEAKSLFDITLKYNPSGVAYFFYAVCTWGANKDRKEAIHYLRMAEEGVTRNINLRGRYYSMFLEQPVFSDVKEDEEFLRVFNR